jgi:hypothetical protein
LLYMIVDRGSHAKKIGREKQIKAN